jgi:hypothetical protein
MAQCDMLWEAACVSAVFMMGVVQRARGVAQPGVCLATPHAKLRGQSLETRLPPPHHVATGIAILRSRTRLIFSFFSPNSKASVAAPSDTELHHILNCKKIPCYPPFVFSSLNRRLPFPVRGLMDIFDSARLNLISRCPGWCLQASKASSLALAHLAAVPPSTFEDLYLFQKSKSLFPERILLKHRAC